MAEKVQKWALILVFGLVGIVVLPHVITLSIDGGIGNGVGNGVENGEGEVFVRTNVRYAVSTADLMESEIIVYDSEGIELWRHEIGANPTALAFDSENNLYASTTGIITKFDSEGNIEDTIWVMGPDDLRVIGDIVIDKDGDIFVAHEGVTGRMSAVTMFSKTGLNYVANFSFGGSYVIGGNSYFFDGIDGLSIHDEIIYGHGQRTGGASINTVYGFAFSKETRDYLFVHGVESRRGSPSLGSGAVFNPIYNTFVGYVSKGTSVSYETSHFYQLDYLNTITTQERVHLSDWISESGDIAIIPNNIRRRNYTLDVYGNFIRTTDGHLTLSARNGFDFELIDTIELMGTGGIIAFQPTIFGDYAYIDQAGTLRVVNENFSLIFQSQVGNFERLAVSPGRIETYFDLIGE